MAQPITVYERMGHEFFVDLARGFYERVAADDVLRALYPDDLEGARQRLEGFLVQYWGGPADYSAERGHPRLRMRHGPFAIGPVERDAWLENMLATLDSLDPPADVAEAMVGYFQNAAMHLQNRPGSADSGASPPRNA
ncbi:MAG: globin [Actinomycetota bacterium]|nr:globin [Actinomycetota bacterium]